MNVIIQKQQTKKSSKIPKIISGILAIISIISIGFCVLPTALFWISWESLAAILVAFGCIGEWWLFIHPSAESNNTAHRRKELQYITAVAVGVTMEVFALAHAIPEALRLEREVQKLRAANDVLDAKMQDRTISDVQSNLFMLLVKDYPKIPIRVFVGIEDGETLKYAGKIRNLLDAAGYNSKNNEGVVELGSGHFDFPNPKKSTASFGVFAFKYGTNGTKDSREFIPGLEVKDGKIILHETNAIAAFAFFTAALDNIGLQPSPGAIDGFLKPGEFCVFVPEKSH